MFPRSLSSRPLTELSWFRRLYQLPYEHMPAQVLEESWDRTLGQRLLEAYLVFSFLKELCGSFPVDEGHFPASYIQEH